MNSEARPHRESPLRLLAGAVIAVALVTAVIVSLARGGSPEAPEEFGDMLPNPVSTSTGLGTRVSTTVRSVEPDSFRDSDVQRVSEQALNAWGRLATTGDLDPLRTLFHPLSPQLPLLEAEGAKLLSNPPEGSPYVFTMDTSVIAASSPGFVTVKGSVTTMRGGAFVSRATWLLVVVQSEDHETWMIWTLEEVE